MSDVMLFMNIAGEFILANPIFSGGAILTSLMAGLAKTYCYVRRIRSRRCGDGDRS